MHWQMPLAMPCAWTQASLFIVDVDFHYVLYSQKSEVYTIEGVDWLTAEWITAVVSDIVVQTVESIAQEIARACSGALSCELEPVVQGMYGGAFGSVHCCLMYVHRLFISRPALLEELFDFFPFSSPATCRGTRSGSSFRASFGSSSSLPDLARPRTRYIHPQTPEQLVRKLSQRSRFA